MGSLSLYQNVILFDRYGNEYRSDLENNNDIKMFIDDEEVVCNNLIEINEEMLSTSSTILNNCYPKSWEETHDYVNNFY